MAKQNLKSSHFHAVLRGLTGLVRERGYEIDERKRIYRARWAIRAVMLAARNQLPLNQYNDFSRWLMRQPIFLNSQLNAIEVGYHKIDRFLTSEPIPLTNELIWLFARLTVVHKDLRDFLDLRDKIEIEVWKGNEQEAIFLCENAQTRFGQSIWLIKTEIAVRQHFRGTSEREDYIKKIKGILGRRTPAFIAHYIGVKNEPGTNEEHFKTLASDAIKRTNVSSAHKIYLRFQLTGEVPDSEDEMADILRCEQSHSDIDIYESMLRVVEALAIKDPSPILHSITAQLRELADLLPDPRITAVLHRSNKQAEFPEIISARPSGEALLAGKIPAAYRVSRRAIRTSPSLSLEGLIAATALAARNNEAPRELSHQSLSSDVVSNLASIIARDYDAFRSRERLAKLSAAFDTLPSFNAINSFVHAYRESPYDFTSPAWLKAASRFSAQVNPDLIANRYAENNEDQSSISPLVTLINSARGDFPNSSQIERQLDEFRRTGSAAFARFASLVKLRLLADQRRFIEICEVVAEEVTRRKTDPEHLNLERTMDGVTWRDLRPGKSSPATPIALHCLACIGKSAYVSMVRFAINEYLHANSIDRPSQINLADPQRRAELLYLLSDVCRPEMLEHVSQLSGSASIEEERIRICQLLEATDQLHAKKYQAEVVAATQRQLLAEGLKIVDSTRIHVDHQMVRSNALKDVESDYERYMRLVGPRAGFETNVEQILRELTRAETATKESLILPASESDTLFIEMVKKVRSRFLYDTVHGLDAYLSRRIRHGTIIGELRGPLERRRLASDRLDSGRYSKNDYWNRELSGIQEADRTAFLKELEQFNKDFDNEAIRLKEKALHIRSKERPHALIDIPITADMVSLVRVGLGPGMTAGDFVDKAIRTMWVSLEPSLQAVRDLLKKEFRTKITALFHSIQLRAQQRCASATCATTLSRELSQCAEEVNRAIDNVLSWFDRSELETYTRQFDCKQAVDIALQSVLSANKTYSPEITTEHVADRPLFASVVTIMTDILLVALGNARAHSGCADQSKVAIRTEVLESEKLLLVRIENNSHPRVRMHASLELLDAIREKISTGEFLDDVRKEGHSGLKKLASTFARGGKGKVDFGFNSDGNFVLEVHVPLLIAE